MEPQIPLTASHEPKLFQCRHIFNNGRRCGGICLRNQDFCYFHHSTRRKVASADPLQPQSSREPDPRPAITPQQGMDTTSDSTLDLPLPEDRSAIQVAIGQVMRQIASGSLGPRRAGLLLYALQIASSNLPKPAPSEASEPTIEQIDLDPALGPLAPTQEVLRKTGYIIYKSEWDEAGNRIRQLEDELRRYKDEENRRFLASLADKEKTDVAEPPPKPSAILPGLQAVAAPSFEKRSRSGIREALLPEAAARTEFFCGSLSNSGLAVRRYSEGRAENPASRPFQENDNAAIFSCWLHPRQLRPVHSGRSDDPRDPRG